jgi:hypothetical protein
MIAQRIRSLGIDWTCSAMNWNSDTFLAEDDYSRPLSLRNRFGYWLEDKLMILFDFFYDHSDEELDAVRNGEIPREYMNERQRAFGYQWALIGSLFDECFCADCDEPLLTADEANLCAACRALHPEMLLEDRRPPGRQKGPILCHNQT